jgi:molybdopterin synthase sulfur carrier subunit
MPVPLDLLYFAAVREAIGKNGERVDPPAQVINVGDLIDWLIARGGGYAQAFADRRRIRAALDQQFVDFDARIAGARELALFPPVTGGQA